MKILTIIPAKLDSKRLPQKNIQEINGKTLVEYSIDYAKASKYDNEIIVSIESDLIRDIAIKNRVLPFSRDKNLCGDAEVVDVYINLISRGTIGEFDLVVAFNYYRRKL